MKNRMALHGVLIILLSSFFFVSTAESAQIFITEFTPDTIRRGNLDGTGLEIIVSGLNNPTGIDVDGTANKIYWSDKGNSLIKRSDFNGGNIEILRSDIAANGIALDVGSSIMYWVTGAGEMQRANMDGTGDIETILTGLGDSRFIELDLINNKIYWTDFANSKIRRANLDGVGGAEDVFTGLNEPNGVTLDLDAGKIYYTETILDRIVRRNLDGSGAIEVLVTGLNFPSDVKLDFVNGKLWWVDGPNGVVQRTNFDGSGGAETMFSGISPTAIASVNFSTSAVPEPLSLVLLFSSLLGLIWKKR